MPAIEDFSYFRFSTRSLPPAQRLPMWHDVFGRSVSRHMLTPRSDMPCHVEMTVRTVARRGGSSGVDAGASVQRMALTGGVSAERTPELLSDGNDDVVLHIHDSGHRVVSQLGREATVAPGGGILTSNADTSTILLPEPSRFVSIGLPRRLMTAMAPGIEDALVRPLAPGLDILRLLTRYLEMTEDEQAMRTPELRRAVATHIHDLCALAVGATRDMTEIARGRGLRAARLRAIQADIVQKLADGNLSATVLARRHRVTPRYIHKLFESEGLTLSQYVTRQRLVRVHRMLSDPAHDDLSISTIAYGAGFGDLATFNRAFRRQFGATPTEVRATRPR